MLTIKQINEVSFRKSSFNGYKPEDVDDFIDEVSESFTALIKENQAYKAKATELSAKNAEMREKLTVLAQKIEAYRDDEDGIKDALLSAQRLGSASIKEAKGKAAAIMADANTKADEMVNEAQKKTTALMNSYNEKISAKQQELDTIKATVTAFRSSLFEMYRKHLGVIESIPDFSKEINVAQLQKTTAAQPEQPQELPIEEPAAVVEEEQIDLTTEEYNAVYDEPQQVPEIGEIEEEAFEDYEIDPVDDYAPESVTKETFDEIDFNAYSDIPEVLKKDKAALYSTLEFGDDIDVKRKK